MKKDQAGGTTYDRLYWTGGGSDPLAESDLAGTISEEYVFFGGKRIARRVVATGHVFYYFADHLGTSRAILQAGYTAPCFDADFYPFGGQHPPVTDTCPQNYKFTGKERDAESNLDYFGARYYASSAGRFVSPDWSGAPTPVPYADFMNPPSLNLYVYALNNPIVNRDPDGHEVPTPRDFNPERSAGFFQGVVNFVANTVRGVATALENPSTIITGPAEALSTAATAYLTAEGRQQMVSQFDALSTQDKAAVVTEAGLQGLAAGLTAQVSGATARTARPINNAIDSIAVPDANVVVRGGQQAPPSGTGAYSGAHGATLADAGRGVPHGSVQASTAGAIRAAGGRVRSAPEATYRGGPINERHVNINGGQSTFSPPQKNPAPPADRVRTRPSGEN